MSVVAQARRRAGVARRNLRLARLPLGRAVTPYIGWTGEGNLGDEAMWAAHRELLPGLGLRPVPAHPSPALARAVARAPWLQGRAVCLGGGTLVGNGHFRSALETVLAAWPAAPRFTLGVGVEDPGYREGGRAGVAAELERWAPLLEAFAVVGVRGPLSRDALAGIGVSAEVVGDPALLLEPSPAAPGAEPGLLGLNVGRVDDQWGHDETGFRRAVAGFARAAIADGWRVRLIPTWDQDAPVQAALAGELGPGVTAAPFAGDPVAVLDELARCDVVVAHKLHACVLAAAGGTPPIALEYRPKCRDFQKSVGRGEFVMRTDRLDASTLLGWAREASERRAAQSAAMGERVGELRARLRGAAARVLTEVAGVAGA